MTPEPCISVVSQSGTRLIVNIPKEFRNKFPRGTPVELIKVRSAMEHVKESDHMRSHTEAPQAIHRCRTHNHIDE